MYKEIQEKLALLNGRKPFNAKTSKAVKKINMLDWIYSSMKMDGFPLGRREMEEILDSRMFVEVTLSDYQAIENYKALIQYADDLLSMGSQLDQKILIHINETFAEKQVQFRRTTPSLRSFAYIPSRPENIMREIRELFRWLYSKDNKQNVIEKAAILHNEIIRIYPFDEFCEATARSALFYFLMQEGLYPVTLGLSQKEYEETVKHYLAKKKKDDFTRALERAVYNKLDVLLQITEEEE